MKNKAVGWIILALTFGIPTLLSIPGSSEPRKQSSLTVPTLSPLGQYHPASYQAHDNSEVLRELRKINSKIEEIEQKERIRRLTGLDY